MRRRRATSTLLALSASLLLAAGCSATEDVAAGSTETSQEHREPTECDVAWDIPGHSVENAFVRELVDTPGAPFHANADMLLERLAAAANDKSQPDLQIGTLLFDGAKWSDFERKPVEFDEVAVVNAVVEQVRLAQPSGELLIFGWQSDPRTLVVTGILETKTMTFFGYECNDGIEDLVRTTSARGSGPSDVGAIVRADAQERANRDSSKTEWIDLDPEKRSLDPRATPPEILARYVSGSLVISWPESWAKAGGKFCVKSRGGWSKCIALDAVLFDEGLGQNVTEWPLTVYSEPSETVTLWLVDDEDNPVANLGDFVNEAEGESRVEIREGAPRDGTLKDLVESIEAGDNSARFSTP